MDCKPIERINKPPSPTSQPSHLAHARGSNISGLQRDPSLPSQVTGPNYVDGYHLAVAAEKGLQRLRHQVCGEGGRGGEGG